VPPGAGAGPPAATAAAILSRLPEDVKVLQIDSQVSQGYASTYYDTPDMDSYLLTALKRRRRFKVRTRSYLSSKASFLEVKTRGPRGVTVKKRIPYTFENRDTLTAEGHEYITAALGDILAGPAHPPPGAAPPTACSP